MFPTPRQTLVIPAYNEAALLPRLLDSIAVAHARYAGGPAAIDVVVADNGSTDATAAIARGAGCRVAPVTKRRIAAARNGGAAGATSEILAFVDADMVIHPETFNAIARALADPRTCAGATGATLDRWSAGLAATYATMWSIAALTGLDTGVVFCRRADFIAVGGYDERRYVAEDVAFLWSLRRLGRSRGQRLRRLTGVKAIASTRKFDRYGDWHLFTTMARASIPMLRRPFEDNEFIRRYWYEDRSPDGSAGRGAKDDSVE